MINFALNILQLFSAVDPACKRDFFGFPHWYKYLEVQSVNDCAPILSGINDIWLIGLAIIELLIRLAVLAAIAFVILAGIKYSESGGNPEKATKAKNTLIDALAGLVIAIAAVAIVSYLGGRFAQ